MTPGIEHAVTPCEGIAAAERIRDRLRELQGGTIAVGFAGNPNEPTAVRGGPMLRVELPASVPLNPEPGHTMTETFEDIPVATDSVYARLGGAPAIRALVNRFYALMDELPEAYTVRCLHPESLAGSADSLFKYLSGWSGGPPLYIQERGHPRLRMRHVPYAIGSGERDEWLLCMRQALAEQVADPALREAVELAFTGMAEHMVNTGSAAGCPR